MQSSTDTEALLPAGETPSEEKTASLPLNGAPSQKAQSWGVVISIAVIVLMITIGAFYAWGQRIAENNAYLNALPSR